MKYIQNLPFILSSKKDFKPFIPATCSFCCFKLQQR